jgi:NitT/TauT family transport system ATP-binding protein
VRGLRKDFHPLRGGRVQAIRDISFDMQEGEFIAVVGPSGCGKSTLLRLLAGLILPTAGETVIAGARVTKPTSEVGIVFQNPVLLPWRTALQNALLPIEVLGLDRNTYTRTAVELLRLVGLGEFMDKYPYELSGGMQQRNAIVRALVHKPKLLLMDEPFGALDAMTREYMNLELLRIWQSTGKTIVFVTHSISEAVFLSDHVLVLSERPGCLLERITVKLPRPRTFDLMGHPEFASLVARVRSLMGQRSGSGGGSGGAGAGQPVEL